MKEALYVRTGKSIKDLQTNTTQNYDSINKAKRASRDLQQSEGLGSGVLKAVKKTLSSPVTATIDTKRRRLRNPFKLIFRVKK